MISSQLRARVRAILVILHQRIREMYKIYIFIGVSYGKTIEFLILI